MKIGEEPLRGVQQALEKEKRVTGVSVIKIHNIMHEIIK